MAWRTFKDFTIVAGGTPQPLIGTVTAGAAVGPALSSDGQQNPVAVNIQVADSSEFQVGDYAILGLPSGVGAALQERQLVTKVPDATHITVKNLERAWPIGTVVRLSSMANKVYVQAVSAAVANDILFIGTRDTMVKATGVFVIKRLQIQAANVQQTDFEHQPSVGMDNVDVGDFWVDGTTTGDKYTPSFFQT